LISSRVLSYASKTDRSVQTKPCFQKEEIQKEKGKHEIQKASDIHYSIEKKKKGKMERVECDDVGYQ